MKIITMGKRLIGETKKGSELYHIHQQLSRDLLGKDSTREALRLYNAEGKVKVILNKVPGGKKGVFLRDGRTIKIDPRLSKGEGFVILLHELEHWKHNDHLKDAKRLTAKQKWNIEDKRFHDAYQMARKWHEGQQKKEGNRQ